MLFIRADGNARIGAGHLMRCLTIAKQVKTEVRFLCADGDSAAFVEKKGYRGTVLGELPFSAAEAEKVKELLKGEDPAGGWLLIDSYANTPDYVRSVRQERKVACLDDMCGTAYPADLLINYNAFAVRENYEKLYGERGESLPGLLLGREYIPVRRDFLNKAPQIKKTPERLLLTTGGGDKENFGESILRGLLREPALNSVEFHVVSGAFHPYYDSLRKLAEAEKNVVLYRNVEDMAALVKTCDLAVTAGGSTIYELCAAGVPFVCFSYAENQDALVRFMGEENMALSAGCFHSGNSLETERAQVKVAALAARLAGSYEERKIYSKKGRGLVDGQGAKRVAAYLESD